MKRHIFLVTIFLLSLVTSVSAQSEEKSYQFEFNMVPKIVHQTARNDQFNELSDDYSVSVEVCHLINSNGHFSFKYGVSYSAIHLNQVDYLAALLLLLILVIM